MAYATCAGCKKPIDLYKNHLVDADRGTYFHSPACKAEVATPATPTPLKAAPQTGSPGPSTGNPVMELVVLQCYQCDQQTIVQNGPNYTPFGDDRTKLQCAWCGCDVRIVSSLHVEPLWLMHW